MGNRGKQVEQQRARELRAQAWTLVEIAEELGVAKSSVSLWVRDVEFTPKPRHRSSTVHPFHLRKLAEIAEAQEIGRARIGELSERDLLIAGLMLYSGEGTKVGNSVVLANSDPRLIALHCRWLRHFFDIDESRLRFRLYLHEGLDLDAANGFWSELTGIPLSQFRTPYRAVPDPSIRKTKHPMGCPAVLYSHARTLRNILGMIDALLT